MGRQCEVSGKKTSFGNHVTPVEKRSTWEASAPSAPASAAACSSRTSSGSTSGCPTAQTRYVRVATSVIRTGLLTLEVDGKMQTFPLIKASRGSAKARTELKSLYPI